MQNNLKSFIVMFILAWVAACEAKAPEPEAEPESILLYCDAKTDKPVALINEEDGSEFAATLSYRGFYRIDLEAETLEARFAGNDEFFSLCSTGSRCKLVSNQSEIRFENHGRRWEDKVIDETYVFERNTGHLYRKSESNGADATEINYASGSCEPVESVDQQLF
ncbi:MAG: hypothetical protein H2048_02760 [Erythrobacter sp.]|nr:hypothetical protein [Erythrobacter sp.]